MKYLKEILDWSEVWAPLIPLTILITRKQKTAWRKPLLSYLIITILISITADILWKRRHLGIENWLQNNFSFLFEEDGLTLKNNLLYNLQSICRFLLFSWFFNSMGKIFQKLNRILPAFFILAAIVDFIFLEDIRDFSSRLFSLEAGLLLAYCIIYFFVVMKDEKGTSIFLRPPFWIVSGLSIYVAINFFIFLFYKLLSTNYVVFAFHLWDFHNISFIIFCGFLCIAFSKNE